MKKTLALVLAAMMMLSLLAVPALAEDQVLKIVTWDATTTPYLDAQKAAFEATHPGVTIEYIDVASQDFFVKTTTMLEGGDKSDIFMVKEVPDLINWVAQGFAAPLNEYVPASYYYLAGFAGTAQNYAVDGELYAIPFRSDFWVLFYNKDLFDAAQVEYPTNDITWDAYAELAKKLADPEKDIYGTYYHTWLSAVANWTVADAKNTLADGEYSDLLYFYKLYQDLEDAGACPAFAEQKAANLHYKSSFYKGNIAMLPMGYWFVSSLINDMASGECTPFNWGIVSVPHLDGVPAGSSFGNLTGAMINAKSENKDLAWEYISWLGGEEGSAATASTGTRPALATDSVVSVLASVEGFPADDNSKAALKPVFVGMEWPVVDKVNDIKSIVNEVHTQIMTRELTPEDGVEEMNERVGDLFK